MKTNLRLRVLTAFFLFLFSVSFLAVSVAAAPVEADKEAILKAYDTLPLSFIENNGQLDPRVRLYVKTSGQTLYFTDEGIVFDLLSREENAGSVAQMNQKAEAKIERLVFNLGFENPSEEVLLKGLDRQEAAINSFVGNDRTKWKKGIPTYKGVLYKEIYKGIDLKVFGTSRDIEYEFIVHPGGDPKDIVLTYNGIEGLATNKKGELLIATVFGQLKETRPCIYQEIKGKRTVSGSFEIKSPAAEAQTGRFSYGFRVASYNPSYPLIIDPPLSYSSYLGGTFGNDHGYGIAVDGDGCAYITGYTESETFPTYNPYQGTYAGNTDAFITKLDSAGALSYSTYLGGSDTDRGYGIAVDGNGCAYVTGETESSDFPYTAGVYQLANAGNYDAFITKLDSAGALSYSTYIGGSYADHGQGIVVDGDGCAYITGYTYSTNFPTQSPFQSTNAYGPDVFITKISALGNTLSYSTYLGGNSEERGKGIAVDGDGCAYITGYTYSTNFPKKNEFQSTRANTWDVFVTKFSSSGSTLEYSTYLGGDNVDWGNGIAVDGDDCAYVTGKTASSDFPTQNPYQSTKSGSLSYDAFITKFSSSGSTLEYSTYLGGFDHDYGNGITVDRSGNVYVTGETKSSDFHTQDPYQGTLVGASDAFITIISSTGSSLSCSTYLGGNSDDSGYGIAVDRRGNPYVAGQTKSSSFPTQNAFQVDYGGGGSDAFVTKLELKAPASPSIPVLFLLLLDE